MLEEPDALANLPGYCGSAYAADFPDITNTTRVDDVRYAVSTLEADPNISLYLDGGNSAWQNVGGMAETLTAADVQQSQGFFLNVSNYQYDANSDYYGTWVSECIAYATVNEAQTPADALADVATFSGTSTPGGAFASPGLPRDHSARRLRHPVLERRRAGNQHRHAGRRLHRRRAEPVRRLERDHHHRRPQHLRHRRQLRQRPRPARCRATHFIVDTSRNGLGPDSMQAYAAAPYDQPASVTSSLAGGQLVQPAQRRPRAQADGRHRRLAELARQLPAGQPAAARRLPLGQDAGPVGRPVRRRGRRPQLG